MHTTTYRYTAYDDHNSGIWLDYAGTLQEAIAAARDYAPDACPGRSEYRGYGPTIVVQTTDGTEVHRERL